MMGWDFGIGQSRAELIRERITPRPYTDGSELHTIAHAVRGNVLWTVHERRWPDGRAPQRWIGCDLLRYAREYGGWGYKDMAESMHPYYYTCPLSFLGQVPEPVNLHAPGWREKVRAYHARMSRSFAINQIVKLEGCRIPEVRILSLRPLLGEYGGRRYRVPRRLVAAG